MKPSRPQIEPRSKQPRSDEVRDSLLGFIRTHFYPDQYVLFAKAKRHLLLWVIWKLAVYLDARSVTLPTERYLQIMRGVLIEALRFGDTGNITYIPAWLGKCVQSHLTIHGEEYYDEGKAIRNRVGGIAAQLANCSVKEPDPVREMANAARLLKTQKRVFKPAKNQQPDLF